MCVSVQAHVRECVRVHLAAYRRDWHQSRADAKKEEDGRDKSGAGFVLWCRRGSPE